MGFQIGVLVDSFRAPLKEGIQKAATVGACGIQMYATSGEAAPENMTKSKVQEIRELVSSYGMSISAVCGDLGGHGFQISKDNPARIEKSKRIMDLALALGSNVVTTHIGVIPKAENQQREVLWQAMNELAIYAQSVGAYFAVETGPEPSLVLKDFLDSLSVRAVRVNLDPANLVMVIGEDPVQSVHTLKDYIVHTHAKDGVMLKKVDPVQLYGTFAGDIVNTINVGECIREMPLGLGSVNFPAYLNALKSIGYNGFLTIEREVGNCPEKDISEAVGFLKSLI